MPEFKTKEIRSLTPFSLFETEAGVKDILGLQRSFTWPFIDFLGEEEERIKSKKIT